MTPSATLLRAAEPVTREGARDAARDELRDRIYHADDPNLLDRAVNWALERVARLVAEAVELVPGGTGVLVLIVAGAVALLILLRLGLGPLRVRDALTDRRRHAAQRTAAQYRAEAELLAARHDWKEALRARFRAAVRELEERGVVDARPGRTADEIAAAAGAAVPRLAATLRDGALLFDTVWYAGRVADRADYERMVAVDDAVRSDRLATARP